MPGKQKTDASSELKSALEGILTAVNSELKTLANDDDEDEDDKEEEEEVEGRGYTKERNKTRLFSRGRE